MDDIQIILYIIFAVIAILARAFKSDKKKPPKPTQQPADSEQREQPQSFEDLLKEFTGETKQTKQPEPQSYESLEEYSFDDDELRRTYESSVKEAKELKTIDELVDLDDDRHTGSFQHFRGYEEPEEDVTNELVETLQDAEGARKAIILSEIMNRKY